MSDIFSKVADDYSDAVRAVGQSDALTGMQIHDLPRRDTGATPPTVAVCSPAEIARDCRRYANHADANGQAATAERIRELTIRLETQLGFVSV